MEQVVPVMDPIAELEPALPKRRGRKPKETKVMAAAAAAEEPNATVVAKVSIIDSLNNVASTAAAAAAVAVATPEPEPATNADDAQPKKGRRGRKPKYVYGLYDINGVVAPDDATSNGNGMVNAADDENVIVRLNISESEQNIVQEASAQDDEHPYAYNHDTYSNIPFVEKDDKTAENHAAIIDPKTSVKVVSILKDFEEKNKHNEWPMSTSISCYWCCHRFNNAPFGIPINYINDTFEVFGCFCSLECAAAHNFAENTCQDEMWERYQLINMLNRKLKLGKVVKPAPPRLSLNIFGGHMEIEQFRGFSSANKFVNVNFPPMTSVTQQLEEINDFELCNDFKYIPIDNDRVNKYKEKIVFKRNKPLVDSNKSLESTMNLKYS